MIHTSYFHVLIQLSHLYNSVHTYIIQPSLPFSTFFTLTITHSLQEEERPQKISSRRAQTEGLAKRRPPQVEAWRPPQPIGEGRSPKVKAWKPSQVKARTQQVQEVKMCRVRIYCLCEFDFLTIKS